MQAMELVDIEDVYPYQEGDVRMNPRDVSSKECREYIGQLAEQFKYNKLNPGQPRVRPILYRDGGIYQIIDGECRYWAMRKLGTKRFYADVFDDLADAETARQEAAKAMVETDAKRALTPEEMSKGVQTMLALDIPDEEVAAVARIDAGRVRRARRATKAAGDAAYDMTLDRLIAIDEFAGDADAVSKLRDGPAKDWRRVYEGMVAERERKAAMAAMVDAAKAAGVEIAGDTPEGYKAARTFSAYNSEQLGSYLECHGRGCVAVETQYGLTFVEPASDGEAVDEEAQREAQEKADFYSAFEDAERARRAWLGERVRDVTSMRSTARLLNAKALTCREVGDFEQATGAEVESSPCPLSVAIGFQSLQRPTAFGIWNVLSGNGADYVWEGAARDTVELIEAMEKDGYEPADAERRTVRACRSVIEGGDDEQ